MIPLVIAKKILLFLVPLVLFYVLKKFGKQKSQDRPHRFSIDKSQIVEGKIVPNDHLGRVHSVASEVNDNKTR